MDGDEDLIGSLGAFVDEEARMLQRLGEVFGSLRARDAEDVVDLDTDAIWRSVTERLRSGPSD